MSPWSEVKDLRTDRGGWVNYITGDGARQRGAVRPYAQSRPVQRADRAADAAHREPGQHRRQLHGIRRDRGSRTGPHERPGGRFRRCHVVRVGCRHRRRARAGSGLHAGSAARGGRARCRAARRRDGHGCGVRDARLRARGQRLELGSRPRHIRRRGRSDGAGQRHVGVRCARRQRPGVRCAGQRHAGVRCAGRRHAGVRCARQRHAGVRRAGLRHHSRRCRRQRADARRRAGRRSRRRTDSGEPAARRPAARRPAARGR